MTEIISNFFGRPKNDTPDAPVTTHGVVGTDVIETAPADHESDVKEQVEGEASEEIAGELDDQEIAQDEADAVAEDAEESTETEASDEVEAADDTDVSDEADEAEASDETEETDEPAAVEADEAEETEENDDTETAAETEPVVETETETVAVVEPEPVAVVEAEAEPARPAAGTRGTVTVDHGVVAKVVTVVAAKIDGVHSLAAEGISVDVDGDVATIKVELVIEFGHAVKALAEQVRTDVIEAVEQFLNFDVAAVDVHVSDIHLPNA